MSEIGAKFGSKRIHLLYLYAEKKDDIFRIIELSPNWLTGERVPLVRMMALALVAISRKITSELKHQKPMTISGRLTLLTRQRHIHITNTKKYQMFYRISWFRI
jgi:hypothetical protein